MSNVTKADLGIGGIISEGWRLFSENFKTLALLALAIYVPISIISYLPYIEIADPGLYNVVMILSFVLSIVLALASIVFMNAMIIVVADGAKGKKTEFKEALQRGWKRFGHMFVTYLLMVLFLIPLYIALVIPGIVFTIFWIFAIYAAVLSDKIGMGALKYSFNMVKGRWWLTLGYVILFSLLTIPAVIVLMIVNGILMMILGDAAIMFYNVLVGFVGLFFTSLSTVWFLNWEANPVKKMES